MPGLRFPKPISDEKLGCAFGRVMIRHEVRGHYELHLWQEGNMSGEKAHAEICLTAAELTQLVTMIQGMFIFTTNEVERSFGHDRSGADTGIKPR